QCQYNLTGIENHGQRFARSLGMPHHATFTIACRLLLYARQSIAFGIFPSATMILCGGKARCALCGLYCTIYCVILMVCRYFLNGLHRYNTIDIFFLGFLKNDEMTDQVQ